MNYYRNMKMPVIYYPIYYPVNNITKSEEEKKESEERFIPFVGGALIGGVLGSAYSRPRYYGYQPYPIYPVYQQYQVYPQYPTYYSSTYSYGYPTTYQNYPNN